MKPHSFSSQGVVLSRRDHSEADRILTVYSKDLGKITLIAKGVKRPESKKRGHLEIFNLIKFSGVPGKTWDIMTEAEIIDPFIEVRHNLDRISVAYYLIEVVNKITHDGEKNQELYDLLTEYLEILKTRKALKTLRLDFVKQTLIILGYWPEAEVNLDPELELDNVIERKLFTLRVGKKVLE